MTRTELPMIAQSETPENKPKSKLISSAAPAPITVLVNDKGGVGKSTATMAIHEFYAANGGDPVPVDLDRGNSDFAKIYLPKDYMAPDIDQPDGFREIYDLLQATPKERPVIVSTPAHFFTRAQQHSPGFLDVLPDLGDDLGRPVRLVFVTDDKRDSVNYLIDVEKHFKSSKIDVIRNNFFAKSSGFETFNTSKIHGRIIEAGGHVIDFPVLAGRIARKINTNRWSRARTLEQLDRFDLMEYARWWQAVCEAFKRAGYAG